MPVRSWIISSFFAAAVLGLGYVAYIERDVGAIGSSNQAILDATAENQAQDADLARAEDSPSMAGSANRLMDDFGSGPLGDVVTVPLKERYRQVYGGRGDGGGGASDRSSGSSGEAAPLGDGSKPSQPGAETLAGPGSAPTETVEGEGAPRASNVRVVERGLEADLDDGAAGDQTRAQPPAATAATPSFDVVRVDPEGNTVLAGRAAPFAEVAVKVGDEVIDRVTATALGEWVSTPLEPLASGDQELSLVASGEDAAAIPSRQVVVVSIPEAAQPAAAASGDAVAVLLDREKSGAGRILQAPGGLQGEGELALKLVDYDDEGAIKLSGEAPPGVPVRIYINNQPAAMVIGDAKGYWITTLDRDLPGGDYTLRLDQLDSQGQTVARLETPLTRVATPPVEGEAKVDYVIVQPGNSLWRIARRLSGDGFNYVYLFEANQAQIRDPDIIYPGQVIEVPSTNRTAG